MAREILFKAKRVDNGKWVEGYLYKIHDSTFIFPLITNGSYDVTRKVMKFMNPCFEVQPEAICQYTGLTDKNGKKIWENDVVYARCNGLSGKGVVQYERGCFVLKDSKRSRTYSLFGEWKFRVDGNIFDNPELLEG